MNLPHVDSRTGLSLILASFVSKLILILLGLYFLNDLVDGYDFFQYFNAAQNVAHGMLPWDNGVVFYYPPLALIPILVAYLGGIGHFLVIMTVLMILCDIITTFCVYYIARKLYSKKTAFIAAVLSATAISAGIFVVTRYDAFPTCLAMLAILFTIYGDKTKGYLASIIGLFVKIWPILIYPFLWVYNTGKNSLLDEGRKGAIAILLVGAVAFGVMIAAGYNKFLVYSGMTFCNTVPFLVSQYLLLAGVQIPFTMIAGCCQILIAAVIAACLYYFYTHKRTVRLLLKLLLISILTVVLLSQYRSPQYIVWVTPLAALLLADDMYGIGAFIGIQFLSIIEFPYAFYVIYVNDHYTSSWGIVFFTIVFAAWGLLLWLAVRARDEESPPAASENTGTR